MCSDLIYMLNSGKEKMLMRGDFDLSLVQRCADSRKEIIKQTMLKQEVVFSKQVHELHRLYWVQKSLMEDLGRMEYDSFDSWNAKAHSSVPSPKNSTRCEPLVEETRFSSTAKAVSASFLQQNLLQGYDDDYHTLQQRPVDVQLSADEFITHVQEDLLKKEDAWTNLKESIDCMHPLSDGKASDPDELRLSLRIGDDNRRKGGTVKPWFGNKSQYCCQSVIDLEESVKRMSDGYENCKLSLGCVASEIYSNSNHKSRGSVFSDLVTSSTSVMKIPSPKTASSSFQEQTCSDKVIVDRHDDVGCNNHSSKLQQFTSNHGGDLDLNNIHFDDSHYSNDSMLTNPLTASSGGDLGGAIGSIQEGICPAIFWKNEVSNCSNEAFDTIWENSAVNPALADLNRKNKRPDIWARNLNSDGRSGSIVSLNAPESMSKPPVVSFEDLDSGNGDQKHEKVELKSKCERLILLDSDNTSIASKERSCEKSEVDDAVFSCTDQSQDMLKDGNGNTSPASHKSGICDHDSSSVKKMNSSTVTCVLYHYSETRLGSQDADASSREHDLRTSDCNDFKREWYNKKRESAEVDVLIQNAAESLISLKNSIPCQASCLKAGAKELENEKSEQPQCSSDSFELNAMNLRESNMADYSLSPKPYELNDVGTKDFGFKLRRGRRMKDFQREILPSLASLSRQEIREDLNIIEGVLRSREYRKMRAKVANNADNWSKLVKSRRSRLNYVMRRNFSWKFN